LSATFLENHFIIPEEGGEGLRAILGLNLGNCDRSMGVWSTCFGIMSGGFGILADVTKDEHWNELYAD
jgi:hypothetical protein